MCTGRLSRSTHVETAEETAWSCKVGNSTMMHSQVTGTRGSCVMHNICGSIGVEDPLLGTLHGDRPTQVIEASQRDQIHVQELPHVATEVVEVNV